MGKYGLDTLQIYFSWDDDLYTFLKNRGLMTRNPDLKVLPLIYSDNCESTLGVKELGRNYVIDPRKYGLSHIQLGWKRDPYLSKFVIPSERPELHVIPENDKIKFKVVPKPKDKNEYHIEYSKEYAFGKTYSNWVAFYFSIGSARDLIKDIYSYYKNFDRKGAEYHLIEWEKKQRQREGMPYIRVKVLDYCFSIAGFEYAVKYLRESGVTGNMPALTYDSTNQEHKRVMSPFLKLGIVETRQEEEFQPPKVQLVMKLAQDMLTTGQRGLRMKIKGAIDDSGLEENYIRLPAVDFLCALQEIREWYNSKLLTANKL